MNIIENAVNTNINNMNKANEKETKMEDLQKADGTTADNSSVVATTAISSNENEFHAKLDELGEHLAEGMEKYSTFQVISRDDREEECAFDEFEETARKLVDIAEKQGVFNLGEKKLPVVSTQKFFSIGAGIRKNKNNTKSICMQFVYTDNTHSELFEFPQTKFINAGRKQFNQKDKSTANIIRAFDDMLVSNVRSNLARYLSNSDCVAVMKDIFNKYEDMESINTEPSIAEVYSRIVAYIYRNKANFHMFPYALDGSTYRIEKCQFERMLEDLSYEKPNEILKLLKQHNMLHLPSSAVGYQAKVKVEGASINLYCIKKLYISEKTVENAIIPDKSDVIVEKVESTTKKSNRPIEKFNL